MFEDSHFLPILANLDFKSPRVLTRVGLFFGGLLLVMIGFYFFYSAPAVAQTIQTCPLVESTSEENHLYPVALSVDINGAVAHPGVYQLPIGSSREDLIKLAGGFGKDISKAYVAKTLNLAEVLKDREKIYLPFADEEAQLVCEHSQNNGQISINHATQKELESLVGVGAVTAGKIVAGRPFAALNELVSRQILSEKVFSELNTKISL